MATKIIHKKSSVASSVPAAGDLEAGELAINLADKKLYSKTTGGTVITVGTSDYNDLENLPTIPDTSTLMPKSGGTFTGSITMEDGDQINVGTSNDLVLSHNNSNAGSLVSYTGEMTVKSNSGVMNVSGSSVKLQRLGSTILEAYSGTVDVTGNIVVSGTVDGVDIASRDSVLTSTTTTANAAMPKAGGTFTGDVSFQTSGLGNPILIDHSHDKMFFPQGKDLAFGSGASTNTMSIKYDGSRNVFTNLSANPIRFDGNTEVIGTFGVNNAYSLPTSDGTAGQVLTTDGSGGVTFADAGGGADLYAANESSPAGQPSATGGNAIAIGDSASATSVDDIAIGVSASANGAYSLAMGQSATVWNPYGVAIGRSSYVNADNAYALGRGATASGTSSYAIGYLATASQTNSVALGKYATSRIIAKYAYAGNSFDEAGDAQFGKFVLYENTTDATATVLTTTGGSPLTVNQVVLPDNSAYSFSGTIIARQDATDGSDFASWEIKGALLRDSGASSIVLGNGIVNKLYASSGASSWAIALSADTTNGGLKIECTGAAATNIRWVATVDASEVKYA